MFWGIRVLRKLCRLRIIAKPEGGPPVMNDLVSARHLPCVVERKTLSKDSSHAHWWRRFGAPCSTPLIGSDCTFLRLLRWGIYGWVGSFPLSCQSDFPLSVSGLTPSLCQVSRWSYHPRCHPLPAWGRVWIEMTLGKSPTALRFSLPCLPVKRRSNTTSYRGYRMALVFSVCLAWPWNLGHTDNSQLSY